jgi:hypothetical protein
MAGTPAWVLNSEQERREREVRKTISNRADKCRVKEKQW